MALQPIATSAESAEAPLVLPLLDMPGGQGRRETSASASAAGVADGHTPNGDFEVQVEAL